MGDIDIRIIVRKLIAAVIVLGMFMTNAIVIHANEDTKSLSPKKVVSILYDDSASMHISSKLGICQLCNTNIYWLDE